MKTCSLLGGLLPLILLPATAQVANNISANQPLSGRVVERGSYYKVMESVQEVENEGSHIILKTNRYTVLANGMNRLDARGNWVECEPAVQEHADAITCTGNSYRVILSRNLNSGSAVDFETSDHKRIVSQPLGIGFFDPETGRSVLLAQIKDCEAEMFSNRVVFPDAFRGPKC